MSDWMARADPPAQVPGPRPRSRSPLLRYAVVLAATLVIAVVVINLVKAPAPPPKCPSPPAPCSVPPVPPGALPSAGTTGQGGAADSGAELVVGSPWASSQLGFSLHYDPGSWVVKEDQADLLQLISPSDSNGSVRYDWVIVEAVPASNTTPQQLIQQRVAALRKSVPDLAVDPDSYYQVNGAEIGDTPGTAQVYVGTLDDTDGTPIAPVRYSIVAATNGRITVAVTVRTLNPDDIADHGPPVITWHMYSRQLVDVLLEDFRWPAAQ
jgi:hypothetical protein